eukprot:31400-Pelagococcus_subviridis.AAC.12
MRSSTTSFSIGRFSTTSRIVAASTSTTTHPPPDATAVTRCGRPNQLEFSQAVCPGDSSATLVRVRAAPSPLSLYTIALPSSTMNTFSPGSPCVKIARPTSTRLARQRLLTKRFSSVVRPVKYGWNRRPSDSFSGNTPDDDDESEDDAWTPPSAPSAPLPPPSFSFFRLPRLNAEDEDHAAMDAATRSALDAISVSLARSSSPSPSPSPSPARARARARASRIPDAANTTLAVTANDRTFRMMGAIATDARRSTVAPAYVAVAVAVRGAPTSNPSSPNASPRVSSPSDTRSVFPRSKFWFDAPGCGSLHTSDCRGGVERRQLELKGAAGGR